MMRLIVMFLSQVDQIFGHVFIFHHFNWDFVEILDWIKSKEPKKSFNVDIIRWESEVVINSLNNSSSRLISSTNILQNENNEWPRKKASHLEEGKTRWSERASVAHKYTQKHTTGTFNPVKKHSGLKPLPENEEIRAKKRHFSFFKLLGHKLLFFSYWITVQVR